VVALGHLGWVFAEDPAEQAEGDLPPFRGASPSAAFAEQHGVQGRKYQQVVTGCARGV